MFNEEFLQGLWSDWTNAQVHQSLSWANKPFCWLYMHWLKLCSVCMQYLNAAKYSSFAFQIHDTLYCLPSCDIPPAYNFNGVCTKAMCVLSRWCASIADPSPSIYDCFFSHSLADPSPSIYDCFFSHLNNNNDR